MWGLLKRYTKNSNRILGSSPRMWGLLLSWMAKLSMNTVHPHVCGVYGKGRLKSLLATRFIPTYVGSTLTSNRNGRRFVRFIPTYVGSTEKGYTLYYEHLRFIPTYVGSTILTKNNQTPLDGSSPRMWGLLTITPELGAPSTVHPHVCGVYEA